MERAKKLDPRKVRVACISDSPKLTTGFGIVAKEFYKGFYEFGFDLSVLGLLDVSPDVNDELDYPFTPVTPFHLLGYDVNHSGEQTYSKFLKKVKPHVIWILTSPGNAKNYVSGMYNDGIGNYMRNGVLYMPPVVLYTPIEGVPLYKDHLETFQKINLNGGKCVFYCESAQAEVREVFPDLESEFVYHGHDHASFRRYSDEERSLIRQMVGLDNKFIVGHFSTNKRTKGFQTLIYAAKILREWGADKNLKFYLHTDAKYPQMDGNDLEYMAYRYGVADLFLFKPDDMVQRQHPYLGVGYNENTLEQIKKADQVPDLAEDRAYLFGHYDLISRYNLLDLYVDVSQVEGWGLTPCEAMMCGVPTVTVNDMGVRKEIHSLGAAHVIEPLPQRCWETWHTGSRLVSIDPEEVAKTIVSFKNQWETEGGRQQLSNIGLYGQRQMSRFKWDDSRQKMNEILYEVACKEEGKIRG